MDDLARDPRSLHLHVRRLLSGRAGEQRGENNLQSPHLLLIVDQFEELFTLCRDETERRASAVQNSFSINGDN
jgi:hypothetical protein